MITPEEIRNRFTYHAPKDDQPAKYEEIRNTAYELAVMLVDLCPESRELSLALTYLEIAIMEANAAIARRS